MPKQFFTFAQNMKEMIQSMTGFGKMVVEFPTRKITIEVKSLNSKQLDLSVRLPSVYREKEMEIRSLLAQLLERGKVDFSIYAEVIKNESAANIRQSAMTDYYHRIKQIADELHLPEPSDWIRTLLGMPDVIKTEIGLVDEEEWAAVLVSIRETVGRLQDFRSQEGAMLQALFEQKTGNIALLLEEIEKYEPERVEKIRARMADGLAKIAEQDYDKNRLEQEIFFYIEKLDVNEEKARLKNHLHYFVETLREGGGQGRKLGFIAQEIGREINTLGSKSNHAQMQQIVVRMKDELEQIKEQVLNVL